MYLNKVNVFTKPKTTDFSRIQGVFSSRSTFCYLILLTAITNPAPKYRGGVCLSCAINFYRLLKSYFDSCV